MKVWFSCCTEFKQPTCSLTALLNSGLFLESVENALLTALLVKWASLSVRTVES